MKLLHTADWHVGKTLKGHRVQLAFEKLGVQGVHVGFKTGNVHLSTFLGLHFVPGVKHRSEVKSISLTVT